MSSSAASSAPATGAVSSAPTAGALSPAPGAGALSPAPGAGAVSPAPDPRAVVDYRIPAIQLRPGDLVNTAPGEDDWQEVLSVHVSPDSATGQLRALVDAVQGRYVVVELTDLTPVDSSVFFVDGTAMVTVEDGELPVAELVSGEDGVRTYLFTRFELVTVRPRPA